MKTAYVLGLGVLLVAASSCKKEKEEPSREQLLTAKNWRVTGEVAVTTSSGQPPVSSDQFASRFDCEKDDFLRFHPDNTLVKNEGPTRCLSTDPQTVSGTWSFNPAKTELTLSESGGAS